ncbi:MULTISPECIES: murein hydrolase activator EnvC family protein [Paenibacillus]|uniref:murein hydrolase activator EnvC family protein n=1 Tax=Paenibacillus TaxID=44249 RepID=UPI0011A27706|nr:M23 family metallopeptidase [Paenibacillus sp. IHBB 10380]
MKKIAAGVAALLLASVMIQPSDGQAEKKTAADVDRELKVLQEQVREARAQKSKAAEEKKEAQHYKKKTTKNLKYVMEQISIVSNELMKISMKIEETEDNLRTTTKELEAAEERIASREKLLESRIRLIYMDGQPSYLDVLLSSTSFSDFLERADSLKTIVNQDQDLLVQHKQDKLLVIEKKKQLETQYATAKDLYAQMEDRKSLLNEKEKEKRVLLAQYDQEIEDAEILTKEQDQMLVALASKRSDLQKEKNKLAAEEAARRAAAAKAAAAAAAKRAKATKLGGSKGGGFTGNGGPFALPVSGARLSSGYGPRVHPVTGEVGKMHTGQDFAAPQGTEIRAADSGTVILAEWWSGYGNCVIVDHGGGVWTLYGHIRNGGIMVSEGDKVSRGQKIAEVGSTGQSTGPHLHFEVRINGSPVNPGPYL